MTDCRRCGFLSTYGRFLDWTPDGTIQGKDLARTRLVFLEVDEVRSIFFNFAAVSRLPVEQVVYRAEKEIGKRFVSTVIPRFVVGLPRNRVFRPRWAVKLAGRLISRYMAGLGMGRADVINYRSGREATFRVKNCHYMPLVAGDGAGVFELLERVQADVEWTEERVGVNIVHVFKIGERSQGESPVSPGQVGYIPGNMAYEFCERCGVPRVVSKVLNVELKSGTIRNTVSGAREVAIPALSFDAAFRKLERQVEKPLPETVCDLERAYTRNSSAVRYYVEEMAKGGIEGLFGDFGWRGIGNLVRVSGLDRGLEVVVENPFHSGMVAGRIAGLYESYLEESVDLRWSEEREGRLVVAMRKPRG